jgi:hypothetical protein
VSTKDETIKKIIAEYQDLAIKYSDATEEEKLDYKKVNKRFSLSAS